MQHVCTFTAIMLPWTGYNGGVIKKTYLNFVLIHWHHVIPARDRHNTISCVAHNFGKLRILRFSLRREIDNANLHEREFSVRGREMEKAEG